MDKGLTPNKARGEGYIATRTNTKKHTHAGTGKVTQVTNVHLHPMVRAKSSVYGDAFYTFRDVKTEVPLWCEQGKPKEIYAGRINNDEGSINYYIHMNPRHESFYLWGYDECPICGQTLYEAHWLTGDAITKQIPLEVLQ
jgi:hypothetical protein